MPLIDPQAVLALLHGRSQLVDVINSRDYREFLEVLVPGASQEETKGDKGRQGRQRCQEDFLARLEFFLTPFLTPFLTGAAIAKQWRL